MPIKSKISGKKIVTGLFWLAAFLPPIVLLYFSLTTRWPLPNLLPFGFDLQAWLGVLFGSSGLLKATMLSALIAFPVAFLSTTLGFITARALNLSRHKEGLMFWALIPFAMSPVILSLCLLYLFLGLNLVGSVGGVFIAQMISSFAYAVIFFTAFWSVKARHLEELVYTLGGTTRQAFLRVLIPASKGPLAFCFFQTFLLSWFQYGLPLVIGAGKVQTLPIKVFAFLGESSPHYASMAAVLLIIPPVLLLLFNRKYLFEDITHVA
jgi:putative spermidine/putrescine transport system permease protein